MSPGTQTGRTSHRGGTTRGQYPLACAAIKAGRYKIEQIKADGGRPMTVVSSGGPRWRVVHDTSTPGQALVWIEQQERTAVQRPPADVTYAGRPIGAQAVVAYRGRPAVAS